jgi:hypothetical protein
MMRKRFNNLAGGEGKKTTDRDVKGAPPYLGKYKVSVPGESKNANECRLTFSARGSRERNVAESGGKSAGKTGFVGSSVCALRCHNIECVW